MRRTAPCCKPSALLKAIAGHPSSAPALTSGDRTITYGDLVCSIPSVARTIADTSSSIPTSADPPRVGFLTPPTPVYVRSMLATWAAGRIAVPLSPLYPPHALAQLVEDAEPDLILTVSSQSVDSTYEGLLTALSARQMLKEDKGMPTHIVVQENDIPGERSIFETEARAEVASCADNIPDSRPAMLIYTSGTTGTPKGVVWTHSMLNYQVSTMAEQWRWSSNDRVLNVLPLHHVHGIVNVLMTSLYIGAQCLMMEGFSPAHVWNAITSHRLCAPTILMAVPTIYQRLIRYFHDAPVKDRRHMRTAASRLRLYVCGSAALSASDYQTWKDISGHNILERYGMTETGMALSNPYDDRERACLGVPFPGVEAKVLSDEDYMDDLRANRERYVTGELLLRGPGVFERYWRRPKETFESFTTDGWIRTGDVVRMHCDSQRFYMMGRMSTDIIKTGGYKVSALEIENVLADCPFVVGSAVFGINEVSLGQQIVCAVISKEEAQDIPEKVRLWLCDRLPMYKVPRQIRAVPEFPRNALGKVLKKVMAKEWKP